MLMVPKVTFYGFIKLSTFKYITDDAEGHFCIHSTALHVNLMVLFSCPHII